jgi:hypothetical protein
VPSGLDDAFDLEITTPRSGGGSGCGSNGGSYDREDVLLPIREYIKVRYHFKESLKCRLYAQLQAPPWTFATFGIPTSEHIHSHSMNLTHMYSSM